MDLQNLENYPVYILNVVPELSNEGNLQIPQQITSDESLPYNFYVPDIEHHTSILNTENVPKVVSRMNNNKISVNKLLHKKTVQDTVVNNKQNIQTHLNTISEKSINELSSLLKDEDIHSDNSQVMKYDPKTDSNIIFYLVRPTDLETENPNRIKVPKRGRPQKNVSALTSNEANSDEPLKPHNKPENTIEHPPVSTKSGRLSKPPKHLIDSDKVYKTKTNSFLVVNNDDIIGRKKVKYNFKSDFVCRGCGKTYLGHKRMQEHLERFPTHNMNTAELQVDSELQDIFQNFHDETPTNIDIISGKKETHTQTDVLKDQHCGYIKSKKNLAFHMKQVMKHMKKSNIIKSLSGTISVWDLLSNTLEIGNLQAFSKELNTLLINLKNVSKSLKLVSKCKCDPNDNNQMFVDDSLGHLFGLPNGSYSLQNTHNQYEIEQTSNVWSINSAKTIEPKVSSPQNLSHHSSPIHLNLFDNQSSKVDFLLSSSMEESIMCDENQDALESVDGLVSERLRTMTDHLHSDVPIIDYPISSTPTTSGVTQPDSFMEHGVYEVFTNDLNLVPTSTEEFIKSLEQFEPLNDSDNTLSADTRMLDFEDLQHTFHTT